MQHRAYISTQSGKKLQLQVKTSIQPLLEISFAPKYIQTCPQPFVDQFFFFLLVGNLKIYKLTTKQSQHIVHNTEI